MTAMQYLVLTAGAALCVPWLIKRWKKGTFKTMLGSVLWLLALSFAGLIVLLYLFQARFVYFPQKNVLGKPSDIGLGYEQVELTTSDNIKLDAWYIPAAQAKFTVLFCHGNAGNIGHRLDSLAIFHSLGLNCLIFDYRGYGNSGGRPSETGTYLDARAAWDWLVENKKNPAENIIIFGRSLGGAVAANLAGQSRPAGLVLESCFTSFVDIAKHYYPFLPVRIFARFDYNTIESVKKSPARCLSFTARTTKLFPSKWAKSFTISQACRNNSLQSAAATTKDLLNQDRNTFIYGRPGLTPYRPARKITDYT